jgi:hypothetical protein
MDRSVIGTPTASWELAIASEGGKREGGPHAKSDAEREIDHGRRARSTRVSSEIFVSARSEHRVFRRYR